MTESELLNHTLELLELEGKSSAYSYLTEYESKVLCENRSQIYNFRYCLAATLGKKKEALALLKEAILDYGYWYRKEVLEEDDDLLSLREEKEFQELAMLSKKRYKEACRDAAFSLEWDSEVKPSKKPILLALHGNQQNNTHSKSYWNGVEQLGVATAYLQSSTIDSFELYRWDDNGEGYQELLDCVNIFPWDKYKKRILAGFSSGCNTILKAVTNGDLSCDVIVLQSPWIPMMLTKERELLFQMLRKQGVRLFVICGEKDVDCIEGAYEFVKLAKENEIFCYPYFKKDLNHEFPEDFSNILGDIVLGAFSHLETESLVLRPFGIKDKEDVFEYASDKDVTKYLTWYGVRSIEQVEETIQNFYSRPGVYAIELKKEHKCIGVIDIRLDLSNKKSSFGYALNKNYWNNGYMSEALGEIIRLSIDELRLNRVEANHYLENAASGIVMQKCGMHYEGRGIQEVVVKGKVYDVEHYGIVRDDYMKMKLPHWEERRYIPIG